MSKFCEASRGCWPSTAAVNLIYLRSAAAAAGSQQRYVLVYNSKAKKIQSSQLMAMGIIRQ
jgi:hypothetical protein